MPAFTELAPSVTDPALLQMATAEPDWRCQFCGSDQRRGDQTCAACGAPAYATPLGPRQIVAQTPGRKANHLLWAVLGGARAPHGPAAGPPAGS